MPALVAGIHALKRQREQQRCGQALDWIDIRPRNVSASSSGSIGVLATAQMATFTSSVGALLPLSVRVSGPGTSERTCWSRVPFKESARLLRNEVYRNEVYSRIHRVTTIGRGSL